MSSGRELVQRNRVALFPYPSKNAEKKKQNIFQMLKFFPFEQDEILPIIKTGRNFYSNKSFMLTLIF